MNDALRQVLDAMPTMLYGEPSRELTDAEGEVLIKAACTWTRNQRATPRGNNGQFAALMSTSLTTKEATVRLDTAESRIWQMIARCTLPT